MGSTASSENLNPATSLGRDIKQVREARHMTLKGLGQATGYSEGYVSKVENGHVLPSEKFVRGCDRAFATGDVFTNQRERLLEGAYPRWFATYLEMERRARRISDYSPMYVMGMLQTEEYARAVLRADPRESVDSLEGRVASRLRRREVMKRDVPPHLWVIVHESALRTVVGDAAVMARQLEHLVHEAGAPNITLQLFPFDAGPPPTGAAFTLLTFAKGPTVAYAAGVQGGRPYDNAEIVSAATDTYSQLQAEALGVARSTARIMDICKEYRRDE